MILFILEFLFVYIFFISCEMLYESNFSFDETMNATVELWLTVEVSSLRLPIILHDKNAYDMPFYLNGIRISSMYILHGK